MNKKSYSGTVLTEKYKGYIGKSKKITYRSSWELMAWEKLEKLYHMRAIKGFAVEETVFQYISPLDDKPHRYYMDITMELNDGTIVFVEIKPEYQTFPPKKTRNKKESTYLNEINTYRVNLAKWNSVEDWCEKKSTPTKKYYFKIWTEKHLNISK